MVVDRLGAVYAARPTDPARLDEEGITHMVAALLRILFSAYPPVAPGMPPQQVASLLAGALRDIYGSEFVSYLGLYIEGQGGTQALCSVDSKIPDVAQDERAYVRASAAFGLALAARGGHPVTRDAESTEATVRAAVGCLTRYLDDLARRRTEQALEAGIPFVRRQRVEDDA